MPLFRFRRPARLLAPGTVAFVGAGPGDPGLLTLHAHRALQEAGVILHDRLVSPAVLAMAPRRARRVDVGKRGHGPAMAQSDINAALVTHAGSGARVVRLKGGDPGLFGRLDEEIDALDAAGLHWQIIPGLTAAQAGAAALGQSLTRRGRNGALRLLTGHDMQGFAEQDWRALAQPGAVAAIYMGKRAARFIQGRMLMHGAAPATPVTLVENASLPSERIHATTLAGLAGCIEARAPAGPALIFLGLAPREASAALPSLHAAKEPA